MMESSYSIYVVPDATTDGGSCYLAYHPELEGCMSHGDTVKAAIQGLADARELYLKTLHELGLPIPPKPNIPMFATWEAQCETRISSETRTLEGNLPRAELTPVH